MRGLYFLTMKSFTTDQVKAANTEKAAHIIIDGSVLDVTKFAAGHPGGEQILMVRQYATNQNSTFIRFDLNMRPRDTSVLVLLRRLSSRTEIQQHPSYSHIEIILAGVRREGRHR